MKTVLLGIMGMGTPEILIIVFIVLLLFGGRKIPELMRGLGQGVKEFKDASKGVDNKDNTPEKKS
jgi:sec-independent protein translocase protein TatA